MVDCVCPDYASFLGVNPSIQGTRSIGRAFWYIKTSLDSRPRRPPRRHAAPCRPSPAPVVLQSHMLSRDCFKRRIRSSKHPPPRAAPESCSSARRPCRARAPGRCASAPVSVFVFMKHCCSVADPPYVPSQSFESPPLSLPCMSLATRPIQFSLFSIRHLGVDGRVGVPARRVVRVVGVVSVAVKIKKRDAQVR